MLNLSKYDYNSDYYRLGSIIYFLIFKMHPLIIKRERNITDIFVDYEKVKNYSKNCIDFMNKLIISDYKKRIGYKDINELKDHSWFKGFNWTKLAKKQINSPFQFVSNINKKKCFKIQNSMNHIIRFKKHSKEIFYRRLLEAFEFININIIVKSSVYDRVQLMSNISGFE